MYGASLKPEPSYSPISSMPSASRGACVWRAGLRPRGDVAGGEGGGSVAGGVGVVVMEDA